LLLRSLETLKVRMDQQTKNAQVVAEYLTNHSKVTNVYYLGLLEEGTTAFSTYKKQCSAPGAMVSFDIIGGEPEAFTFLNSLKLMKLAVSLGGTESLAEHPKTMTHAGVDDAQRKQMNITDRLIRLSIGVESVKDLIWDLEQALEKVTIASLQTS